MALQCQMSLNGSSYSAGQTPIPSAFCTVYNPNASPIAVTGMRLTVQTTTDSSFNQVGANVPEIPLGPGQLTIVQPLTSIVIGPINLAGGSAANVNSFQAVNQVGNLNPVNPQPSQLPQQTFIIGAIVYASDGSVNQAGTVGALISYTSAPPKGYQGGFLNLAGPNNLATAFFAGIF
jgi:hypothetical protein